MVDRPPIAKTETPLPPTASPAPNSARAAAPTDAPADAQAAADPITLLERWGPTAPPGEPMPTNEAYELCHALARRRYENFSVLTGLVPERLRDDFAAVYAYCRWADDLADETHRLSGTGVRTPEIDRARALELLAWWRTGLERCFAGDADHPVYVALAETVRRHDLSPKPFRDLLDAFEQDQRVQTYQTWGDLIGYCRGSADPVGRIVLTLAGHRPPDEDSRSAELYRLSDLVCTALQLTNFWQDVRGDLVERGRVYMPFEDAGLSPDELNDLAGRSEEPEARIRFIKALRPLAERTKTMFAEASDLPKRVDPAIAPVVWLFAAGGSRVLSKVLANGCVTLWDRPKLRGYEKAGLVGLGWLRAKISSQRTSGASRTGGETKAGEA
ncbi:MAG: squalene/phytoene synthase family protein [Planctomycetota bacterium]